MKRFVFARSTTSHVVCRSVPSLS